MLSMTMGEGVRSAQRGRQNQGCHYRVAAHRVAAVLRSVPGGSPTQIGGPLHSGGSSSRLSQRPSSLFFLAPGSPCGGRTSSQLLGARLGAHPAEPPQHLSCSILFRDIRLVSRLSTLALEEENPELARRAQGVWKARFHEIQVLRCCPREWSV